MTRNIFLHRGTVTGTGLCARYRLRAFKSSPDFLSWHLRSPVESRSLLGIGDYAVLTLLPRWAKEFPCSTCLEHADNVLQNTFLGSLIFRPINFAQVAILISDPSQWLSTSILLVDFGLSVDTLDKMFTTLAQKRTARTHNKFAPAELSRQTYGSAC